MLKITVDETELFDESKQEFINIKGQTLQLEHSLVSISKWESKWCKPFLSKENKSLEEIIDYVKCMTITQNVDPNVYLALSNENIVAINKYIDAPMTATTFSNNIGSPKNGETITSELIYYWMIASEIPVEFQKWHLNRLLTLIKICNIKNSPPKKMSNKATMRQNTSLNAARRRAMNSKG